MFDIAVRDRIIAESPFAGVRTSWKRPQEPIRLVPTADQFNAIVNSIRSQRFTAHANQTADFVEFLGLAGLGQAEASSLTWDDVDLKKNRLSIRRHKTNTRFYMPIYPGLKELLVRLRNAAGEVPSNTRVFAIKDAKKALRAACDRLGYPNFSQRSIRRCLIRKLWRSGVDKKLIAKWQGHQDGGQLIIDTYTEAFGDDDAEYERQQIAKIASD
jgi:integrase